MANLAANAVIKVITTDPASLNDLQEFCHKTGHVLLEQSQENDIISSTIKHK